MRLTCLLPIVALLVGCPTPPEAGPQGGNQTNNPGGGGSEGGPGNKGPGGGPEGGPGNNGPGGEGANGPGGPPPEGAGNGPGGAPPEGGPGGEGGEGGEGGQGGQGGGEGGQGGGEGGQGGGEGGGGGQGNAKGQDEGEGLSAPPVPELGEPINGSILIQALADDAFDPEGLQSQEQITGAEHVTFSGTAVCSGCSESLVLRAVPFVSPDQAPESNTRYASISLSPGAFSIAVPVGKTAMALELLVDADGNGKPTKGERFAVLELGGQLIPSQDRSGLELNASDREFYAALPVNKEGAQVGEPAPSELYAPG